MIANSLQSRPRKMHTADATAFEALPVRAKSMKKIIASNVKKIAAIAEANYVGVVPHNPLSAVLTAACVQVDAATHNIPVQEYPPDDDSGVKADLVREGSVRHIGLSEASPEVIRRAHAVHPIACVQQAWKARRGGNVERSGCEN